MTTNSNAPADASLTGIARRQGQEEDSIPMTAVDTWLASHKERLELTAEQAEREDPTQRGSVASCPDCGGPLRINLDTFERSCDRHGVVEAAWQGYRIVEAA